MNIKEKLKELENTEVIEILDVRLNIYDHFYQFKLSNNEYILVNGYGYIGEKIDKNSGYIFTDDSFGVWKESVIDRVEDDEFFESGEYQKYLSQEFLDIVKEIDDKNLEHVDIYNRYIELSEYGFDTLRAIDEAIDEDEK